jgi:excisionase family DNA binding protein
MPANNVRSPVRRRLHRLPEAVEYLGGVISLKTLRQWVWRRQIEYVHIGRTVCIPQDVLDTLIEENTTPALEDGQGPRKSPRSYRSSGKERQQNV